MSPHRAQKRHRIGVLLHRWHHRAGLFAALFLIWLAISGLLLNEHALLGLDSTRLDWPWLMRAYGLHGEQTPAFSAGSHYLLNNEGQTLLDGKPLALPIPEALGMVELGGLLYVATPMSLVLLKADDGQRIDELRAPPLPATPLQRIALHEGALLLQADQLYASTDGESWQAVNVTAARWSQAQPLSAEQQAAAGLRPSLPLTRVLADLHSGQVFGVAGKRLIDLVALAAILLAVSGLWATLRRRHHKHH